MDASVRQYLNGIPNETLRYHLERMLKPIADRLSTQSLTSAGLVIKAASNVLAKTGAAAWYGLVKGKLITLAAGTDMAALSGTVVNATHNVFMFYVDAAGTLTSQMGTAGATIGAMTFPVPPEGKVPIGFVYINPTGTGDFVGGTTALDDATVAPNAVYVNHIGPVDPSVLLA